MARMICKCGEYLSNSSIPNDTEIRMYTYEEWSEIQKLGKIDSWLIPSPKYNVWKCPNCKRIYVFEYGKEYMKKYKLKLQIDLNLLIFKCNDEILNSSAKDKNRLWVYTDIEWDRILCDDIIEMNKFPNTKYDVIKGSDCEQIYVFEKGTDNLLMVYELDE